MIRWLQALMLMAGALILLQAMVLALGEPLARRRFALGMNLDPGSDRIGERVASWPRRLRRGQPAAAAGSPAR